MKRFILKIKNKIAFEKGQTLIEILVALGIITVVVSALSSIVITSQGNVKQSKNQGLSMHLAQEALEIVRQIRDNDYTSFKTMTGTYCLAKDEVELSSNCYTANADNFLRKVRIVQSGCGANISRIEVTVSWQSSRCPATNSFCHKSALQTCLNAVYPVPTF